VTNVSSWPVELSSTPVVLAPYDFSECDAIVVRTFQRGELNHVAYGDVAKTAKHGIPMGSDPDIAGMSG
jgi:hypothetical protein